MSGHIAPIYAWCPVDKSGALQVQYIQYHPHNIMLTEKAERSWRIVRVVVDLAESWEEREAAAKAIADLPDAVGCAMLGGQRDEWATED